MLVSCHILIFLHHKYLWTNLPLWCMVQTHVLNLLWQTVEKRGCLRHWWTSGVRDDEFGKSHAPIKCNALQCALTRHAPDIVFSFSAHYLGHYPSALGDFGWDSSIIHQAYEVHHTGPSFHSLEVRKLAGIFQTQCNSWPIYANPWSTRWKRLHTFQGPDCATKCKDGMRSENMKIWSRVWCPTSDHMSNEGTMQNTWGLITHPTLRPSLTCDLHVPIPQCHNHHNHHQIWNHGHLLHYNILTTSNTFLQSPTPAPPATPNQFCMIIILVAHDHYHDEHHHNFCQQLKSPLTWVVWSPSLGWRCHNS